MKLSAWRKREDKTQGWVASEIGVTQSFISLIERAIQPQTPNSEVMRRIYILTAGDVQPNDFYNVSDWEAARIRAEGDAALGRKAA